MKNVVFLIMLALPFAMIFGVPTSAKADSSRLAEERLRIVEIDVNYDHLSLTEVMADLARKTGVSITMEQKVKTDVGPDEVMVSLNLRRITGYDVLTTIAKDNGLRILFKYGIAWLTTPEYYYAGRNVLRIYDVRDLTMTIRNFQGIKVRLNTTAERDLIWEEIDEPKYDKLDVDTLEDIIPEFTGGGDWSDNPGAYIHQLAGLLLIRQAPEVHIEIMRFLGQIRMNR